tara:strand:+ start:489 stop:710 length:222 start_codon:yes stop_codon:yes gene_type:complete
MFEAKTEKKFVQTKKNRVNKVICINKIKILQRMAAVEKIIFINCSLRKIQLAKEIFVIDIEQGSEVMIPKELS